VQDLTTVSLDHVIGGRVPVKPAEAYAVLQFVWERLCASRDGDGRMMPLPALDALAISATGDIDAMRPSGPVSLTLRPPHVVAQELGHLLSQLLWSGGPDTTDIPAACLDVVRRVTLRVPAAGDLRPIGAPKALFTALEAFRPRDTNAARAALFARWLKTSRGATTRPVEGRGRPNVEHRLNADAGKPSHAEGVPSLQPSATHRAGGRSARAAGVELRLHFDATAGPEPVQAAPTPATRPSRPPEQTTRGRLSLVVGICAAVLGVLPI
jgi:hypothetical protein